MDSRFEVRRDERTWLLLREHRTADGCVLLLATDISALKRRDEVGFGGDSGLSEVSMCWYLRRI